MALIGTILPTSISSKSILPTSAAIASMTSRPTLPSSNCTCRLFYFVTQCMQRASNFLNCLFLFFKRYQFNPHLLSMPIVVNILAKALTTFPSADFNLCLYLLNDQITQEEAVVKLMRMRDLLEGA